MAIGDIKVQPGRNAKAGLSVRAGAEAFGAGIARAVGNLGAALGGAAQTQTDIAKTLQARKEKQDRFAAEESYQRWSAEQNREQAELLRQSPADGRGVTNASEAALETARTNFLERLPESVRDEYAARATGYVEDRITSAFNFEYQQGNRYFQETATKSIEAEAGAILNGSSSYDEAAENVGRLVGASDLPELEQLRLLDSANQMLAKAAFQKEVEYANSLKGTVRGPDENDVVAAGLLPHERGMLNAIASPESGGRYNVRYDGSANGAEFDDFSQHPGIMVQRPDGRFSSAAGRYQFTLTTWKEVSRELGLTDFSPESQDRAALHLARKIYNRQAGPGELTFDQVLQSGNRDLIASMKNGLTDAQGGWEGFRHMSDDAFTNIVLGAQGIAGGGTGSQELPDLWQDERFASLTFEEKLSLGALGAKQAAALTRAEQQQQEAAFKAAQDSVFLAATQGGLQLSDEAALLERGVLRTSDDVTEFRRLVNASQKQESARESLAGRLTSGGLITTRDNGALNDFLGGDGLAALEEMDPDYAANTLFPVVARAGFVPSETGKLLNSMMLGSSPDARDYATQVLTQIQATDPRALENSPGISKAAVKEAVLSNTLRPWYSPEQVRERMEKLRDPVLGTQIRTLRKEAAKVFEEEVTDTDLTSQFETWLPGDQPDVPLDPGQQVVFRDDMKQLFVEGMLVAGEAGPALEYAAKMARQQWGVSSIGGEARMMKNSPERFYPQIESSHSWIDQAVRNEFNLVGGEEFQMVADSQTLFEGNRYSQAEDKTGLNNASYQIVVKNADGTLEVLTRPDGLPERFAPEITAEMEGNIERSAAYADLVRQRDAVISTVAGTKGAAPAGAAERLQSLEAQMRELSDQTPDGDPTRIVPESSLAQLEAELAQQRERAEIEKELFESGRRPTFNNAPLIRIERLEEIIAQRKANAQN